MSKRNKIIIALALISAAISLEILEMLSYDVLSQELKRFLPAALFGGGFSALILAFVNNNKQKKLS